MMLLQIQRAVKVKHHCHLQQSIAICKGNSLYKSLVSDSIQHQQSMTRCIGNYIVLMTRHVWLMLHKETLGPYSALRSGPVWKGYGFTQGMMSLVILSWQTQ